MVMTLEMKAQLRSLACLLPTFNLLFYELSEGQTDFFVVKYLAICPIRIVTAHRNKAKAEMHQCSRLRDLIVLMLRLHFTELPLSMDLTHFDPNQVQCMFDKHCNNGLSNNSTQMEVKDDVASFLETIYADQPRNQGIASNSGKILLNHELNGNNGDLMPRGDPFMGSFSNQFLQPNLPSNQPGQQQSSANNDFGL